MLNEIRAPSLDNRTSIAQKRAGGTRRRVNYPGLRQ